MKFQPAFSIGRQALNADNSMLCILGVNENIPPPKFRYFEKYKISFKKLNSIYDSGQWQIDLVTFNSSTRPGAMVHVMHVQFVIFENFDY